MENDLIIRFDSLPSTSLKAKELINNCVPWTVVVAEQQYSGHGTKGTDWFSPKGGLYFSIILPPANIQDLQIITILSAFTIAKVIKNNFDLEPMIKIPNDILINGKKFCGILTENIIGQDVKFSIIGIGINTNIIDFPDSLKDKATSILNETGIKADNNKILDEIILDLKNQFKEITN
ncbi:MAG: biotin--[acetyl-CoA-carboxylase] ligase [Candidatus Pacebacteria bacterium]|nr:biotin--[acetyl-CoA-carboxylase] ligase [Candidatus Paceibacterota bacterium]